MKTEALTIPRLPDPWDYALVRGPNGNECDENGWPLTHPAAIRRLQYFELLAVYNHAVAKAAVKALREVQEGEGQFDFDRLQHAKNTIENMKEVAIKALREIKDSGWKEEP